MQIKQFLSQRLIDSRLKAGQERGVLYRLRYGFLLLAFYPCALVSHIHLNLNILVQEIHILFWHIEVRRKALDYFSVIRSYSACSPTQCLFWSRYSRARSACISEMASKYPKASPVSVQLLLEGWDTVEKWASQLYSPGSCTEQSASNIPTLPCAKYTPAGHRSCHSGYRNVAFTHVQNSSSRTQSSL
jgi:hypothetical protein